MSAVEDCIERIKKKEDVQAYVICTKRGDLLRHYQRGETTSGAGANSGSGSKNQTLANKERAQKYCDKLKVRALFVQRRQ